MSNRDVHLNLVESSRRLFALDPGAQIEAGEGWMFGAGTATHPVISNAAFRTDDGLDPDELLKRARAFFDTRGRGFALWTRVGVAEDEDLIAAAEAGGLEGVHSMPEMVFDRRVEERPLPNGAELRRVEDAADAAAYWQVAAEAYRTNGFPPEVFGHYTDHEGLYREGVAAFLTRLDGEPASIAMTIVTDGVAGIYWVGSTERARGRGLGWASTAAAVNAGFDLGARTASLQASPAGEPIYRRMGFATIYDYRLYLAHRPGARLRSRP